MHARRHNLAQVCGFLMILTGCAGANGNSADSRDSPSTAQTPAIANTSDAGAGNAADAGNVPNAADPWDASDSGDSGNAAGADPCRSQCPLDVDDPSCVEQPIASFPTLEVTLDEWSKARCGTDKEAAFPYLLEVRCDDGTRVLYYGGGFSIERRYYDPSGRFIALETGGDVVHGPGPGCHASAYWPVRVACNNAEATNVVCGTASFKVGDSVPL